MNSHWGPASAATITATEKLQNKYTGEQIQFNQAAHFDDAY